MGRLRRGGGFGSKLPKQPKRIAGRAGSMDERGWGRFPAGPRRRPDGRARGAAGAAENEVGDHYSVVRVLGLTSDSRGDTPLRAHPDLVHAYEWQIVGRCVPPADACRCERVPKAGAEWPERAITCRRIEVTTEDERRTWRN